MVAIGTMSISADVEVVWQSCDCSRFLKAVADVATV